MTPPSLTPDPVLELVTPPLDGVILPGVVRQSLLDMARTWVRARWGPGPALLGASVSGAGVGAGVHWLVSVPLSGCLAPTPWVCLSHRP